ncbi:MAG: alpha/beta hydrolase [Byssovorax sp.]
MTALVEMVQLTDVTLACGVSGPPGGPLVLLAHGFPDDASTFRAQVPALVAAGFRCVTPTLRGYAPSGRSTENRYDAASLGHDLVGLADHYAPRAKARLVGHDWGAIASFAAAAIAPDRFSHLVTMAVPHARALLANTSAAQLRRSWYMGFFQLPRLAETRLIRGDHAMIDELWRDWSPGYRASEEEMRRVKEAISGREPEVLAYYRALLSPRALLGDARKLLLAKTRVPALHLHGEDDGCVGVECARGAERWYLDSYAMKRVAGAGHFLQRERPEEINAALLGFFG